MDKLIQKLIDALVGSIESELACEGIIFGDPDLIESVLVEAKAAGYSIPEDFIENVISD